jgi:hypothetical protein
MATITANGGAERFWRNSRNGSRVALCRNGRLLINPGGASRWKRTNIALADLTERSGWREDNGSSAKAAVTKTTRGASVRERAKKQAGIERS